MVKAFGGKKAAPFAKRKSKATNRKKNSVRTAKGTIRKKKV